MESSTPKKDKNSCNQHKITYSKCNYENCEKTQICKFCALNSKEELKHFYEHFDDLKSVLTTQSDQIKNQVKDDEFYLDLNKAYEENLMKALLDVESYYSKLMESKLIISEQIIENFSQKYKDITTTFEELVVNLKNHLGSISTDSKFKEEVKKMRKNLDEQMNFLSDPKLLDKDFEENVSLINKKLNLLKLEDLLNGKFRFNSRKNNCDLDWTTFNSPIMNNSKGIKSISGSYWTARSKEVFDGAFECKILIRKINSSLVNSYWNYSLGLIRLGGKETDYYMDSVILQSNGYLATQFSSSGSGKQIFFTDWKVGDVILMKRDEQGNIYYGINNETSYQIGFEKIMGTFNIVMGFSSSAKDDEFEIIELIKM